MDKNILKIKDVFASGGNIIQYLKDMKSIETNSIEDILISYDFQSGNYTKNVENSPIYYDQYATAIASVMDKLGAYNSIIEVGVGEATTLANLIPKISQKPSSVLGFDISWSRINYANRYLEKKDQKAKVFVADLFNIPLNDNAIDIVYTSHSIEPNGGREKEALKELYRITKKYLVLFEPTNEFATVEGKVRMKKHGYIHDLKKTINELGYKLVEYKPFDIMFNKLNPTGLYIIEKLDNSITTTDFYCPIAKQPLKEYADHYYSETSLVSYPKIMNIPCLCSFYGVLTSKHDIIL